MDIKTNKIINVTLVILLIILILILCWIYFSGKSFSRYKTTVTSNSIAQVAKPVFNVDGDYIKIDGIEDTSYKFSVKNYDSSSTSEVKIKYYIEIVNNSQANLTFKLLDENNNVIKLDKNKSTIFELNKDIKQSDNYILNVKYTNDTAIVDDIQGNVQIKVEAVQSEQ